MSVEHDYDWSCFDVHMSIATDRRSAYDCWATSGGMERFFARRFKYTKPDGVDRRANACAEVDDAYWLEFHHPSELKGKILATRPGEHFAFTFGDMRVDVTFTPNDRGTLIRLTQSSIPTDDTARADSHLNCRSCWVYYLLNLRSVVEHGHDLRDDGLPDNPVSIHFGAHTSSEGG